MTGRRRFRRRFCPGSLPTPAVSAHRRPVHETDDEEDDEQPDNQCQGSHVARLCRLHEGASPILTMDRIPGRSGDSIDA